MRLGFLRLAAEAAVQRQSSASSLGPLKKPQLKGLLGSETKVHAVICFVLAIGGALAYSQFVAEPRKKKYAEFWRNYDSHADFKRMVKAGVWNDITIEDVEADEQAQLAELKKRYAR